MCAFGYRPGLARCRLTDTGLGERIKVRTTLSSTTIPVDVAEFEPPHRMVWRGGMPLGLRTGTRTFSLSETGGVTSVDVHEVFTGPLVGILVRVMPDLQPSFDAHLEGLRRSTGKLTGRSTTEENTRVGTLSRTRTSVTESCSDR